MNLQVGFPFRACYGIYQASTRDPKGSMKEQQNVASSRSVETQWIQKLRKLSLDVVVRFWPALDRPKTIKSGFNCVSMHFSYKQLSWFNGVISPAILLGVLGLLLVVFGVYVLPLSLHIFGVCDRHQPDTRIGVGRSMLHELKPICSASSLNPSIRQRKNPYCTEPQILNCTKQGPNFEDSSDR